MRPRPLDMARGDVQPGWLSRSQTLQFLGVSDSTLRRRNRRGRLLPHYTDPDTGRCFWNREALDREMRHAVPPGDEMIRKAVSLVRKGNAIKKGCK